MKVLAIVASARKGKSTDTLVERTIEGIKSIPGDKVEVTKINLHDYNLKFCKDCLRCRDTQQNGSYIRCVFDEDIADLYELVDQSDSIIIGMPLHFGHLPGILTVFLEKICWGFGKPEQQYLNVEGCPLPRSEKKREAAIVITNSIVPPLYRMFCDSATPTLKVVLKDSLNAKWIGDLYGGNIKNRGVDYYKMKAFKLGQNLYRKTLSRLKVP